MWVSFIQRAARLAGWSIALTAVAASIVPIQMRPYSGLPAVFEHFAGYFVLAALLAIGHGNRVSPGVVAVLLIFLAAALEVAQVWIPGRDAAVRDIAASAAGACAGAALAWGALLLMRRRAG